MICGRRGLLIIAVLAAGLSGRPVSLYCQVVRGHLRSSDERAPIPGALIVLIDSQGKALARFVTNTGGQYILRAPAPGRYRLEAQRIGYHTARSPMLQLDADSLDYDFEVSLEAITLPMIEVTSEGRGCERRLDGAQVATIWGEIRKALDVTAWTERFAGVTYTRQLYRHVLDGRRQLLWEAYGSTVSANTRVPFTTATPLELATHGFATVDNSEMVLFGPDAEVLTSDLFQNGHCFSLTASARYPNSLGLAFQPLRRRRNVVDISGVLWVDRRSSALQRLEYAYTNLPAPYNRDDAGSELSFERLPTGLWIVRSWTIRSPTLILDRDRSEWQRITNQAGGLVQRAVQDTTLLYSAPGGSTIEGVVRDEPGGRPQHGARVVLSGTGYAGVTDAAGRYRIAGVPPGRYSIGFTHPLARDLRVPIPLQPLSVDSGAILQHDLVLPQLDSIQRQLCPKIEPLIRSTDATPGLVYGFVADAAGRPMTQVKLRALWAGADTAKTEIRDGKIIDLRGFFAICWVPTGQELLIRFSRGEKFIETRATLPQNGLPVARIDLRWQ